ncbi:MAG: helix-turn-helix domain-containing protein [Proteobacteria bacterium]|nr:helix-turn-helix domain-containing protein [Pseudomonadota bacterium]
MSYQTPKQLAYEFNVSETTVIRWCRTGYLPSYKVGGRWWIDREAEI